jgi:hypothetical protein
MMKPRPIVGEDGGDGVTSTTKGFGTGSAAGSITASQGAKADDAEVDGPARASKFAIPSLLGLRGAP